MKLTLSLLEKRKDDQDRHWPAYIGGRVRTSTLVLIVAFLALWWVYSEYHPQEQSHSGPPSTQVVPPGFVPDPNYTWVPRSKVQEPPTTVTVTPTPTPTETTTTTPSPPPLLPPIVLPPPFGPPTSATTPPPGPAQPPAPPKPPPLLPGLP